MQLASAGTVPAVIDFKSASMSLVAVMLRSADLDELAAALASRLADTPDLFDNEPVLIDLSQLPVPLLSTETPEPGASDFQATLPLEAGEGAEIDFNALLALLRHHHMQPLAVRGGSLHQCAAARAAGLSVAPDAPSRPESRPQPPVLQEVIREVQVEVQVPATPNPTVIIDKPLRSGQQVYAKGADLVVLAVVNHGAEVIADGSIHVYAPLRGRAIAGARGHTGARIFATTMEPELISIAGIYRTTENPLPADVLGKQAQIRLEGEKLIMEPLKF
jgi:septum site-determining protein MinC